MSGVKSTFQMMATMMGGSTMGMMKRARIASRTRESRFRSSAAPRPRRSWTATVNTDNRSCTPSELRNRPSPGSSRKFARGRLKSHHVAGRARLRGVRLVRRRKAKGASVTTASTRRAGESKTTKTRSRRRTAARPRRLGLPDGATCLRENPLDVTLGVAHRLGGGLLARGDLRQGDAHAIANGGKLGHGPVRHVPGARLLEHRAVQSNDMRAAPVVLLAVPPTAADPRPRTRGIAHRLGNPPHLLFRRGPLDELPRDLFLLGARRNLKPMDCGLGEASRGPSRRQREPHPILDLALGWVCGQPD